MEPEGRLGEWNRFLLRKKGNLDIFNINRQTYIAEIPAPLFNYIIPYLDIIVKAYI